MEYDAQTLKRLRETELEIFEKFIKVCDKNDIPYFAAFGTAIGAERHGGFIPWDDDLDIGMLRSDYERFLEVFDEMGDDMELINPLYEKDYCCSVTHVQKKGTKFVSQDERKCNYHKGINMDIFVFDNLSDNKKLRRKQLKRSFIYGRLIFLTDKAIPHLRCSAFKKAILNTVFFFTRLFLKIFGINNVILYKKLEKVSRLAENEKCEYVASFCCPMSDKESIKYENIFPLKEIKFEHLTVKVPNRDDLVLTKQYGNYMQLPPVEDRVTHRPYIIEFAEEKQSASV